MQAEIGLAIILIIVLLADLFQKVPSPKNMQRLSCALLVILLLNNLFNSASGEAFGSMYINTPMTSVVKTVLTLGTILVFMQADTWLEREDTRHKAGEFYLLTLSTLLGMFYMVSAGSFLLFYVGLELASIPMACLIAFDKNRHHSAEAGAKFILNAMFSSGLMLYGLSLVYGTCGTMYFNDISTMITGSPLQILAMVLFFAGLGFKLSLVPFHMWTPDTYQGAPTTVSAYLSVISKGAAAFALMSILLKVFGPMVADWSLLLSVVIVLTITIANIFAILQKDLKRFMAYSSISQAGYIMLGVISGSAIGMTSLVYYILVYMISNLAAFGVIAIIENRTGKITIDDYNGLYSTNPKLSIVMMLALFSLAGIPPFAGFFSKFFIFAAAAEQGFYVLVFIALLNTIISLYYYLLVVKAMFINKTEEAIAPVRSDIYTRLSLIVCTAGILILGLLSTIYEHIGMFSFGITF